MQSENKNQTLIHCGYQISPNSSQQQTYDSFFSEFWDTSFGKKMAQNKVLHSRKWLFTSLSLTEVSGGWILGRQNIEEEEKDTGIDTDHWWAPSHRLKSQQGIKTQTLWKRSERGNSRGGGWAAGSAGSGRAFFSVRQFGWARERTPDKDTFSGGGRRKATRRNFFDTILF